MSLSRGFLHGPVGGAGPKQDLASKTVHRINQHVDDVSQVVVGDSEGNVISRCLSEGLRVAEGFIKSALTISPKSVVTASTHKLAQGIAAALSKAGQPIQAVEVAEDLGIATTCGARRAMGAFAKRLARGRARAERVRILARANPKASRLYSTGVCPQQKYGACIAGAAPSQIKSMRRTAAMTVATAGVQPCTSTLLCWRLGAHMDPAIALPLEEIRLWMGLWARTSTSQRAELRMAWARALPRILLKSIHCMVNYSHLIF